MNRSKLISNFIHIPTYLSYDPFWKTKWNINLCFFEKWVRSSSVTDENMRNITVRYQGNITPSFDKWAYWMRCKIPNTWLLVTKAEMNMWHFTALCVLLLKVSIYTCKHVVVAGSHILCKKCLLICHMFGLGITLVMGWEDIMMKVGLWRSSHELKWQCQFIKVK